MNINQLSNKFSQGINWNAFFYSLYKTTSVFITLLLFKSLSTKDFSIWANINSIIFLTLLWLDFGMRKSIPRYCPEFAKSKISQKRFVKLLLLFQMGVLMVAAPIFIITTYNLSSTLKMPDYKVFLAIGGALFILEGIISLLRLIYHAHFWIKQFNIVTTIAVMGETIANLCIMFTMHDSIAILKSIFVTKIIAGLFVNTIGICMLPRLYCDRNYPGNNEIDFNQTLNRFIKHSGIMWINNNIKSLSERNFLVPFFTITLGAELANIFKVANDGALLFQRIVVKSIGTADTALLSHIEGMSNEQKLMPIAFQKLMSKIAALCFPLLGILLILLIKSNLFFNNPFVFQTFFIMAIGYLIELIGSPYERILEIKRRYGFLFIAYAPYAFMLSALLISDSVSCIGLIQSLLIIHGVRLVSSTIMIYLARTHYLLSFPMRYVITLVYIYTPLILFTILILSWYPSIMSYITL